jgi:hypothetical protein
MLYALIIVFFSLKTAQGIPLSTSGLSGCGMLYRWGIYCRSCRYRALSKPPLSVFKLLKIASLRIPGARNPLYGFDIEYNSKNNSVFSICLTKHYVMKTGVVEVYTHVLFISTVDQVSGQLHASAALPHWIGSWVGLRAGLDDIQEYRESNS